MGRVAMNFVSFEFAAFLVAVYLLHWSLSLRRRPEMAADDRELRCHFLHDCYENPNKGLICQLETREESVTAELVKPGGRSQRQ
jgi:hypothetical protein